MALGFLIHSGLWLWAVLGTVLAIFAPRSINVRVTHFNGAQREVAQHDLNPGCTQIHADHIPKRRCKTQSQRWSSASRVLKLTLFEPTGGDQVCHRFVQFGFGKTGREQQLVTRWCTRPKHRLEDAPLIGLKVLQQRSHGFRLPGSLNAATSKV
jgi:hypothetical protein